MRRSTHEEIASRRLNPRTLARSRRNPVSVVVDNVRSLYNVGSIFRTSDGARIEKLYLAGFTPRPPRREIEKTALGATETVPWEFVRDARQLLNSLKAEGYTIACLELMEGSVPYYAIPPTSFPLCLVIGNEVTGVSAPLAELCDLGLEIPMFGMKQSLNVAVAYGIAVFELVRIFGQSHAG